jgi:uncharacterized membrane protein YfcA
MAMGMLLLTAFLSMLIGGVLGLVGGGGGILAVPLLVYGVGTSPKAAIASSLFFVGATSLVGTALQARQGHVRWSMGALFGTASMAGAFLGARLARFVPEQVLLAALASVMLLTALAMLRGRAEPSVHRRPLAVVRVLAIGLGVGMVSGLVGAGGGFLIVPALTLFGGLAMHEAIGTSLFIIAVQSFAGFAGHVGHVALDPRLIATMTSAAMVGMIGGSALGQHVSAQGLKKGFSALVLATGLFVLGRQLPLPWMLVVTAGTLATAAHLLRRKAVPSSTNSTEIPCTTSPRSPH